MRLRTVAAVLATSVVTLGATPVAAYAGVGNGGGIVASYHGKKINLRDGWAGAQACAEFAVGDVRCYDTTAEADRAVRPAAGTAAPAAPAAAGAAGAAGDVHADALGDCVYGWVCLWQDDNYKGRRLQWSAPGTKKLADWNFRDKASSGAVNRVQGGVECVDYRTGLPDPRMFLGAGGAYRFPTVDYPYGGTWNDRVDEIKM
jgi:hypothetical protein